MTSKLIAVSIFGIQISLTGALLGFTSASSILRPGLLSFIILCPYFQFPYLENIHYAPLRGALGAACIYTVVIYIDVVLLNNFTFEARGPTSAKAGLTPVNSTELRPRSKSSELLRETLDRFRFGLNISTQGRFPATKWPVKNIPPFSRTRPNYVPQRGRFQYQTAPKVVFGLFLLVLLGYAPNSEDKNLTFSSMKIPLLTGSENVSRHDIITRIGSVLGYWTVQYIIHVTVHGLLAMIAVTLGASEVKAWPPVFGSIRDAYSIRRFWGNFYHQLIRHGCSSIAYFITYTFLRFKKGGLIGRYLFIFFVFSVSGTFHMFCDVSQGIPLQESGAMKFFVMQSFGIMFEDSLLWILKHFSGQQSLKHNSILRMIGYVWVAAWLVWSSPAWLYPTMRRSKGEPIIPVPSHVENYMRNMLLHVPLRPIDPATNTNLVRLVFLLVSTVLALILVLVGTVAIIQPNILSRNTELSLKEDTPNEGKLKARQSAGILQERSREVVTPWILLFGVKGLALGLILCTLLYMGDLTAAAIVVLMLYVVAVGETYVMSRYGERGSIKKVVIPSLLLLWVGPVFLFLGPKSRESSPERNSK